MVLKIFFSWQVETNLQGFNNKAFLIECIESAIKQIENRGALKGIRLKLTEGLRNIPGNPEVSQLMFDQIDNCDIFIGDITVVQKICSCLESFRNKKGLYFRYSPNCNVYGEYNRALGLHKDFWRQTILLLNDTNKSPKEDSSIIPFDTRDRRWPIVFSLKDNSTKNKAIAKEALMKVLPEAIHKSALAAREWIDRRYYPFSSWFKQNRDGRLSRYKVDADIIDKYKTQILKPNGVFLFLGPEGLFKTYFILRIFEEDKYANNYLYVDCRHLDLKDYKPQIDNILEKVKDAIIVIDNGVSNDLQYILDARLKYKACNKIIFVTTQGCIKDDLYRDRLTVIDATEDLQNEVSMRFDQAGIILQQTRQQIENFCDGNIGLITNILSNVHDINRLDERRMVTLMYGADESTNERIILRSLSLFDCIGWKEDKAEELVAIILNKDITPLDIDSKVLLNRTKAFINKLIRDGLVIEKGRTISLYPRPAAQQLVIEWLEGVDVKRFIEVLKAILKSPHHNSLAREFHDRFKYLGQYNEAHSIIESILRIGGGFDEISILNSDVGAMLMESFVQVHPEAVAKLLSSVFNSISIEGLRKIDSGRRYLVWTIEKLCFKQETFQQGAYLMMRMAIAENESISNNATGEFIRLFPIMLPATSATLNDRFMFLKNNINVDEHKPIVLSAIKRATFVRDFILMDGAETFGDVRLQSYRPQTEEEIRDYLEGCLGLIMTEVTSSDRYLSVICELMENNTIALCDSGYADLILPKVKIVAKIRHDDWEKMQETLSLFRNKVGKNMAPDLQSLYDEILDSITKQDVVSRFARIEKESYQETPRLEFKKRLEIQRNKYKNIADEIYERGLLTDEVLGNLIKVECISSYPFGKVLAEHMLKEEQVDFIEKYIKILNRDKDSNIAILCDFISSVENDVFDKVVPTLQESRITYTIFACLGIRNIMPDNEMFSLLLMMVEDKRSDISSYIQYWSRIRQDCMTEERLLILFSDVLSFEDGLPVAVSLISSLLWNNRILTYPRLIDLIEVKIKEYHLSGKSILKINNGMMVFKELIQDGSRRMLAGIINESIIQAASQNSYHIVGHNYNMEEVYRVLMNKYFDVIWPSLSQALLSDGEDFMTFYYLKDLLGVGIIGSSNSSTPIIMEGNHFDEMLDWCKNHPDIAPARLASMIPAMGDNGQLTPQALKLIELYADKDYVLEEIGCTIDSFASIGSVVPYYETRKNLYRSLLHNSRSEVREWAQRQINACDYYIQYAQTREEEKF